MQIKEISKKDFKKVIQFAIKGMHFEEYLKNRFILNAYGRYFWYLEYTNATQVLAAYEENELLGVLVVDMKDEPKPYKSFWKSVYVKFVALEPASLAHMPGRFRKRQERRHPRIPVSTRTYRTLFRRGFLRGS